MPLKLSSGLHKSNLSTEPTENVQKWGTIAAGPEPNCGHISEDGNARSNMNQKGKIFVGILTALAMMLLTFALPRGGAMRDAAVVQFPVTVGIWAIFVLLFVKLK